MRTNTVDFHIVDPHQRDIDRRLVNWARWCNGTSAPDTSPMFRMMPPSPRVRGEPARSGGSVDGMDAVKVAKSVAALPHDQRAALNWYYVKPTSPRKMCQALGCSMAGLQQLVRDGRQMLIEHMNDARRNLDESLTRANNSSDLSLRAHQRSDADLVAAAGLLPSQLGRALIRLRSEYDAAARPAGTALLAPIVQAQAPCGSEEPRLTHAEVEAARQLLLRLKTLPAVHAALMAKLEAWGTASAHLVCAAVLSWWLDDRCPSCNGTRYEVVPGGGRQSARRCKACKGSGVSEIPQGEAGRQLAGFMDHCVSATGSAVRRRLG